MRRHTFNLLRRAYRTSCHSSLKWYRTPARLVRRLNRLLSRMATCHMKAKGGGRLCFSNWNRARAQPRVRRVLNLKRVALVV